MNPSRNRRQFLQQASQTCAILATSAISAAFVLILNSALFADDINDEVLIHNRHQLSAQPSPCHRIALGEPDDYKPCLARLPSGELLLTAFHQQKRDGNKVMEQTLLFRSMDGGKTWSQAEKLDLLGREPYLTVLKDGTVFITGHLLADDVRNEWGYTCGFLHRYPPTESRTSQ